MRVLVTGSSGYIAPHLVTALKDRGDYVVGIDRLPPTSAEPHVFVHGDLNDEDTIEKALSHGIDTIAHLAAARADWGLSDEEYIRDNVSATKRIIDVGQAVGVKRWLFYSTVGVLGSSDTPLNDSAPHSPQGAYGLSKATAEALFEALGGDDPSAQVTMVRPSAVYGPGNPENTNMFRLIDAIYRSRFVMIGDGDNTKTMSYLPNLIEATIFLLDRMRPGVHKYIYVDAPAMKTSDLVARIYELLGRRQPRWRLPMPLATALAYPADVLAQVLDVDLPITSARIQKFCRSTNFERSALEAAGFEPTHSPEDALAATVEWYLATNSDGARPRIISRDE